MIDPGGRLVERLPHGTPGGLVAEVRARAGVTPYVRYGDWVGSLATVASAVLLALAATRPTG